MDDLNDGAARIRDRRDLSAFLDRLADSLLEEPESWENDTLERFLRAWSVWLSEMDGYFIRQGQSVPEDPTWRLLAQSLLAARVYE